VSALGGDAEVAKLLVECKADLAAIGTIGRTPRRMAVAGAATLPPTKFMLRHMAPVRGHFRLLFLLIFENDSMLIDFSSCFDSRIKFKLEANALANAA
jgi:hypothetical protein